MSFSDDYSSLVCDFKAQVEKDNRCGTDSVFLPNIRPQAPVDFVLIGAEPSLGGKGYDAFSKMIDGGFKNFALSFEDFILHFCVREYLCKGGRTYYLTDLSKGAMTTKVAKPGFKHWYKEWHHLLREELALVEKPSARRVAIGGTVRNFLNKLKLYRSDDRTVIHYSGMAAAHRGNAIKGREDSYRAFAKRITLDVIIDIAKAVLRDAEMEPFLPDTLKRLNRGSGLTESRKKLMFDYKVAFEEIRESGARG